MYVDRFIENCPIALRNLNSDSVTGKVKDQWKNVGNAYGAFACTVDFCKGREYYCRFDYKYTSAQAITSLLLFYGQGAENYRTFHAFSVSSADATTYSFVGTFNPEFVTDVLFEVYQGSPSNPSDLVGYLRNVLLYDVTDLWAYLKAKGTVTDSASSFKTWADANLEWKPYGESYTPSVMSSTLDSIAISKGTVIAGELVETDGMTARTIIEPQGSDILDPYFDTDKHPYKISNSAAVSIERADAMAQGSPLAPEHKYVLKVTDKGRGTGGFFPYKVYFKASRIYLRKIVAKIPVGYTLRIYGSSMGDGYSRTWLTPQAGTGKWEEYTLEEHSSATGTVSPFEFLYLESADNTSAIWYVAYYDVVDITDQPTLRGYTALPTVHAIGKGTLFMRELDEVDLFPAGRTVKPEPGVLPSGWTYDTEDYAGDAKYSIVIPVGQDGFLPQKFPVDPSVRYKISMWIKCKTVTSTNILPTIVGYTKDNTSLASEKVFYIGSPTSLTADLNPGDTVVKVSDSSTFKTGAVYGLGFRGHWARVEGYNRLGTILKISNTTYTFTVTDATTLTLAKPYSGATIKKGAIVVNSIAGSQYPYPFDYITSSEYVWQYVEGYFGVDGALNDGKTDTTIGTNWKRLGLSKETAWVEFAPNFYSNHTNDPIKICDIRIRPEKRADGNGRLQGDVEIKAYN